MAWTSPSSIITPAGIVCRGQMRPKSNFYAHALNQHIWLIVINSTAPGRFMPPKLGHGRRRRFWQDVQTSIWRNQHRMGASIKISVFQNDHHSLKPSCDRTRWVHTRKAKHVKSVECSPALVDITYRRHLVQKKKMCWACCNTPMVNFFIYLFFLFKRVPIILKGT